MIFDGAEKLANHKMKVRVCVALLRKVAQQLAYARRAHPPMRLRSSASTRTMQTPSACGVRFARRRK